MQLSILLPTYRHDLLACSRIAQACSWAGPKIEVIIRDNSGNAKKRELLPHFQGENCKIIIAEPCEPSENFSETLRLAKGEFVFCVADDDMGFDRAIAALPDVIDLVGKDSSISGVTGTYIVEAAAGAAIINYQGLDSDDARARLVGYLSESGPNTLFYSALRREMLNRVFAFMSELPLSFSFHDQIICMLFLLNGKFHRLNRLLYLYDIGVWELSSSSQTRDVDFYKNAGLDPAINKLHWFLCGFEGSVLIRNSDVFPDYALAQRQAIADLWFSVMFTRFKGYQRATFDSPFTGEVDKLYAKLLTSTGQLSFQDMLTEICNLMARFSKDKAQSYHDFWSAALNRRTPIPPLARVAAER
jgi:hypothetical protein